LTFKSEEELIKRKVEKGWEWLEANPESTVYDAVEELVVRYISLLGQLVEAQAGPIFHSKIYDKQFVVLEGGSVFLEDGVTFTKKEVNLLTYATDEQRKNIHAVKLAFYDSVIVAKTRPTETEDNKLFT